ncbi:recombinase family protein [Muricauda sp. MAR_2010_75]|uniref:recombinase family protein n=1 Tax=Allomuricauda sp. MAR_2010_75 TaxID=1250232 RepID=UPI00055C44D5|nr:recombinase family protein [Muricauda sp. MAR_2010_75]
MKKKIGLLYRVSSKPQEVDGSSLDTQKEMGRKMSKVLGYDYVEFNEGVQSSYNVEINFRPKLVELLNEIQKPKGIRKVWVFNTDRLGRYSNSWYSILKVFLDYGVEVYVGESDKPYDLKNLTDKLTIGLLSLISQYDNELRRMRSVMGKRNSLKSGNTYLGSTIPFGYSVKNKNLIIDNTEGKYVKKIFKMYDEGQSTMDIKMFLDKQVEIQPRKSKYGWNLGTIQKMLRNTLYIGKQVWRWEENLPNGEKKLIEEIEIETPKIIDKKVFDRVQKRMDSSTRNNTPKESQSLLRGLLECSVCGLMLPERNQQNSMYYGRCKEYKWKYNGEKFDYNNCGLKKGLRTELTDTLVLDKVLESLTESKRVREEFKKKNLEPKWENENENKKKLNKIKGYINKKEKEKERIERELVQIDFEIRLGKLTSRYGEQLKDKFSERLTVIDEELQKLKKEEKLYSDTKGWVNWIEKMYEILDDVPNFDNSKKRTFLKDYVESIKVNYNPNIQSHELDISFLKPIIGDTIIYKEGKDEKGFKRYDIEEGENNLEVIIPTSTKRNRISKKDREKLNNHIYELKIKNGLSHSEVCEELNNLGLRTPTNKIWDKPKFSSYYNYIKKELLGKE